jgi:hypothetical protein
VFLVLRQFADGVLRALEIVFRQFVEKSARLALQQVAKLLPRFGVTKSKAAGRARDTDIGQAAFLFDTIRILRLVMRQAVFLETGTRAPWRRG